jgi:hypothetical protein
MHQARVGSALPDRHLERLDDELGAHLLGHRPADAAATERIDDDSQVELALPGRDLGQIGYPEPIRRLRREVAAHEIRRRGDARDADRGLAVAAADQARQAALAHQPRDALAAHAHAAVTQLGMDARPAVGALALAVDRADRFEQLAVARWRADAGRSFQA